MLYYTFEDKVIADQCLATIHSNDVFPIINSEDKQSTTKWAEEPLEMLTGSWAVPKIPDERLDTMNMPTEQRQLFLMLFGQDILDLTYDDFIHNEEVL